MRRVLPMAVFATFLMALSIAPGLAQYEINFILGQKMLEEDDWAPVEDQGEFGVAASIGGEDWPVLLALDLLVSATEETVLGFDVDGSTSELAVGIRKIWHPGKARPFVGGGLAFINGEVEAFGVSEDDNATGYWVNGGVFWRLGARFNIGVDVRISRGEVELFGFDAEAGGEHIGLILGFGKPK